MEEKKWEDLAMDCLVNVFGRLSINERIMVVPLVCKPWYRASLNPDCWRILKFHESETFSRVILDRSCGSATEVALPPYFIEFQDLRLVSEQCPLLQVLHLPHIYPIGGEEKLSELICKWKDLQFLYMRNVPSNFGALCEKLNHHCKNFTGLQACGPIDDEATSAIIKWIPRIKYLDLSSSCISKKNLLIILHGCRELEHLSVNHCHGFNVDEEILQKSSHIKNFTTFGSFQSDWDDDDYDQSLSEDGDDYSDNGDDYSDDEDDYDHIYSDDEDDYDHIYSDHINSDDEDGFNSDDEDGFYSD